MNDPFADRLSEYLDGELAGPERAEVERHLEGCAACRGLLADLGVLVERARSLGDRAPERDSWPALRAELAPSWRPGPLPILAFAAGILVTLSIVFALARGTGEPAAEPQVAVAQYLLLLHEPEHATDVEDPAEHAAIVERYAAWARGLGERCLAGDELAEGGFDLRASGTGVDVARRPDTPGGGVGGYFIVRAEDEAQALELARTSPHLSRGGWIELRRIVSH